MLIFVAGGTATVDIVDIVYVPIVSDLVVDDVDAAVVVVDEDVVHVIVDAKVGVITEEWPSVTAIAYRDLLSDSIVIQMGHLFNKLKRKGIL